METVIREEIREVKGSVYVEVCRLWPGRTSALFRSSERRQRDQ